MAICAMAVSHLTIVPYIVPPSHVANLLNKLKKSNEKVSLLFVDGENIESSLAPLPNDLANVVHVVAANPTSSKLHGYHFTDLQALIETGTGAQKDVQGSNKGPADPTEVFARVAVCTSEEDVRLGMHHLSSLLPALMLRS